MSQRLIDQQWFINEVSPTPSESEYLNQNYEEVIRRVNDEIAKGVSPQVATVKVCKEMLGK